MKSTILLFFFDGLDRSISVVPFWQQLILKGEHLLILCIFYSGGDGQWIGTNNSNNSRGYDSWNRIQRNQKPFGI